MTRDARTSRQAAGFTLLEVLLVVILLGLLMAGAYSGIHAAAKAMHAGSMAIDRTDRLRTAQQFLRRQIEHILPLEFAQDRSTGRITVFSGNDHSMRFVGLMPGYLSRGGPYVQTLELVRGKHGLQLQFTDTMLNGYDLTNPRNSNTPPVVLLNRIRDGRFEYRSLDDQGELTDWSSDWPDPSVTPLMVRIELQMEPGVRAKWPVLDVALLLNAGAVRPQPAWVAGHR